MIGIRCRRSRRDSSGFREWPSNQRKTGPDGMLTERSPNAKSKIDRGQARRGRRLIAVPIDPQLCISYNAEVRGKMEIMEERRRHNASWAATGAPDIPVLWRPDIRHTFAEVDNRCQPTMQAHRWFFKKMPNVVWLINCLIWIITNTFTTKIVYIGDGNFINTLIKQNFRAKDPS
jgi:hypothetical protein